MEHYFFNLNCYLNKYYFSSNGYSSPHDSNKLCGTFFYPWMVGVTDGDGTFSISNQKGSWILTFAIAQSCYNIKLLAFIKIYLNIGSINIDKISNMAMFRIRDRKILLNHIIPIFDSYPLLTTKYYYYDRFKKVLNILENNNLSKSEKDTLILSLLKLEPGNKYISPAWNDLNIMSKPWVIGFIEAEGSFYIVNKNNNPPRMTLGFGITQKLDKKVLEKIASLMNLETKIRYKEKHNYYILDTTKNTNINSIIDYFDNQMIGMKNIEFKIWKKSLIYKNDYDRLKSYQERLRKLKTLTPNLDLFK